MKIRKIQLALTMILTFFATGICSAAEPVGKKEYTNSCAVCHGANGKGNGPIIDFLSQAPADLTQIQKKNSGNFPLKQVYDTIIDAGKVRAHGNQIMPIWGDRYAMELIAVEGEFGNSENKNRTAQARVLELVFYLGNIQE